jgi:hypothetical protein
MIRLAVLGVAALLCAMVCGAAWSQARQAAPSPEKALAAVIEAGCKRAEADSFIRFHCEEGQALWYFTREGRPEHPAYLVFHDRQLDHSGLIIPDGELPQGRFGFGRGDSGSDHEAFKVWNKEVLKSWTRTAPHVSPFFGKREPRGKVYPLDPS